MKILAIVPSGFCFGLQSLTLSFFGEMPSDFRCHFLNTRWSDGEFARRLDGLGISHSATWLGMFSRKLDWVNLRMSGECLLKLPIAWFDFLKLYFSFRPDVIYLANHHELILLWPVLVWLRKKVVCHMHDPPPPIAFQKWSFFFWRRVVSRFFFISENVRKRSALLGPARLGDKVIHNGVVVNPVASKQQRSPRFCHEYGWPDEAVIFGITGQMSPHKGHEDFIGAAAIASSANIALRFVIGGCGSDDFMATLREKIQASGIEGKVAFCGWLPTPQQFYESIDVLLLASRHDEGFGLVVAEAGERALPVIATRSGGAMEIVNHLQTGLLIEKNDTEGMASAMVRLGSDSALRKSLGMAARERVALHFNLETQSRLFWEQLHQMVPRPTSC